MAVVSLAMFEAVNAITGDYEPYLGTVSAPDGASPDAAAVAAAYRVLRTYVTAPATVAALDAARAASLAAIPAGQAKDDGIAVGEAAAAAVMTLAASDGSSPAAFFEPLPPPPARGRRRRAARSARRRACASASLTRSRT